MSIQFRRSIRRTYALARVLVNRITDRIKGAVLTRPFSFRKLPGWAEIAVGVAARISSHEERARNAFEVMRDMGGDPEMIASVVTSPWFSAGLILSGVGYLVFVGEPQKGIQRQPWWPIVGWSVVSVCMAILLSATGYGYFQYRVMEVAGGKINEIQQQALGGQLFWHMTELEKLNLGTALAEVPEASRFEIKLRCVPTSSSSQTYAIDLLETFKKHNWKATPDCMFNNVKRDLMGIYISVPKEDQGIVPSIIEISIGTPQSDIQSREPLLAVQY